MKRVHLLTKIFCVLSKHPQIKIYLYIGKGINGTFSIWGWFEDIFTNKVDFWRYGLLVKLLQFLDYQPDFLIFFYTHAWGKMGQVWKKSGGTFLGLILHCGPKSRGVCPSPNGWAGTKKILADELTPKRVLWDQVWAKSQQWPWTVVLGLGRSVC